MDTPRRAASIRKRRWSSGVEVHREGRLAAPRRRGLRRRRVFGRRRQSVGHARGLCHASTSRVQRYKARVSAAAREWGSSSRAVRPAVNARRWATRSPTVAGARAAPVPARASTASARPRPASRTARHTLAGQPGRSGVEAQPAPLVAVPLGGPALRPTRRRRSCFSRT